MNLGMAQALVYRSQETPLERAAALEAANLMDLAAFGSASLLQGRLAGELPEEVEAAFPEATTGATQALQFARSSPGLTAALVGVSRSDHAREVFGLAKSPPAAPDRVLGLFS